MLIKINDHQWIESKDIYLIDKDQYENELHIYINQHPKIPVIIKGDNDILTFTNSINFLYKKDMINGQSNTKNEQGSSENILEQLNQGTKS